MDTREMTPTKVRAAWDKSLRSTRADRQTAAVNSAFMRNRQWIYWNKDANRLEEIPRSPVRVRTSVPRIGPSTRRTMAKLTRRGMAFTVPPVSPDDASAHSAEIAEAALVHVAREQSWESLRADHANCVWEGGVAGISVEWDDRVGEPVAQDETGRAIHTGDVKLTVLSIHEIAFEPGTRDGERARYWIRGQALPPDDVRSIYNLEKEPKADARALDTLHQLGGDDRGEQTPLTMVFTYYERPMNGTEGRVMTVIGEQVIEDKPWPFPFTDRLNISLAVVTSVHGKWIGDTPVTDAVPVQAVYNASWSSIVEHIKLAGNARLWVPMGSVDDPDELTDTAGEAVTYNPINGKKPEYDAPPSMPDWWIRQPAMLEDALDDILGVHDISRGEAPTGVESGIALSILSENDDTPVGALAKHLGECWGRVATMVLHLYRVHVQESRRATVLQPKSVPSLQQWSGKDIDEEAIAIVPIDSVMPRSRAAQAAYAMQLWDRGLITSSYELAKVAELPDQDDLIAGIDPDTDRAQRENYWLATGQPRVVADFDNHANHVEIHRDFMRSARYERLDEEAQQLVALHIDAHVMYAAGYGAQQTQAAGFSPLAAMLPTVEEPVLPSESLAAASAMQAAAPGQPMIDPALIPEPETEPPPEQQPQQQPASASNEEE